jgi:hypothetical protein
MPGLRYGRWLEEGFYLFKRNAGVLILSSLIAVILSVATAGILAGPMTAGMILITLSLLDSPEQKVDVGLLLKGFNYFVDSFLFFLVWGVATGIACLFISRFPCLGHLAAIFVIYVAQALLMFGPFLIVDRGMGFKDASSESYRRVSADFWHFLSFSAIASIVGTIGAIFCGIGVILTLPIQACIVTVAYRDVFERVRVGGRDEPSNNLEP